MSELEAQHLRKRKRKVLDASPVCSEGGEVMEGKIIIVPKARPAVDFASNLLVIPKDDVDEYVKEIDKHHVDFIRSLESSWAIMADGRAVEAVKMAKEKYEEIIAEKDKLIEELKKKLEEVEQ